jgi:hypothetical protein
MINLILEECQFAPSVVKEASDLNVRFWPKADIREKSSNSTVTFSANAEETASEKTTSAINDFFILSLLEFEACVI